VHEFPKRIARGPADGLGVDHASDHELQAKVQEAPRALIDFSGPWKDFAKKVMDRGRPAEAITDP